MNLTEPIASRRGFIESTGRIAAASVLAGVAVPRVHAAENNTLRIALIGCGGRGTGAAANALSVNNGPIKLVAMADVFPERVAGSYKSLKTQFGDKVDVPDERKFVGFDGYRKAMDCLKPGDVPILTTPPAFRWVHFGYAIEKGLNLFMEKPTCVDGPSGRKMLDLAEKSLRKNLKVGVGFHFHHSPNRIELHKRIQAGDIGQIIAMRAYRQQGPKAFFLSNPKPDGISELLYQVQRFHSFLWASGGCYNDFYIHNIDECCWMKDAWPVQAQANGGRHFRGTSVDQNFDNYSVEYTFADGTKLFFYGRNILGCCEDVKSFVHGTRAVASITQSRIYRGQKPDESKIAWKTPPISDGNAYQYEWDHLIDAIRHDRPYNEALRGTQSTLVSCMGRMAAHTGQIITYDKILHCDHEFAPNVDKLTMSSPAPLRVGPDGKYPVPQPGITTKQEY
jgi:predicted dehydrogenase